MTIKARKHVEISSHNDKVLVFDGENGELGENEEQVVLLKMINQRQKLLKTLCNAAAHQHCFAKRDENEKHIVQGVNMEEKVTNVFGDDSEKDKNQGIANLTSDEDCDHLLILAQSAELMLESEVNSSPMDVERGLLDNASDSAIAGQISEVKQINEMPANNDRREEIQSNVTTPRLIHVRRLARSMGRFPVQPTIGKNKGWNLQGRRVRLTDIRRLARHKFQKHSEGEEDGQLIGNSGERTIRFSQLKQMARCKSNSLTPKPVHGSISSLLHRQTFEVEPDNQKAKIMEEIFGVEDTLRVTSHELK